MKKIIAFFFYITFLIPAYALAAAPLFTFTPLTNTTIQLPVNRIATIQYTVQNQSPKTHVIVMRPIRGITQLTSAGNCPNPFTLVGKQSCQLTLQVNGSQIGAAGVYGGPVLCQSGTNGQPNSLLCYQPSLANSLHVTTGAPEPTTFYAGMQNGNVYYSTNNGSSWTATAAPSSGSAIHAVFATTHRMLYAGAANGFIYYSTNQGSSWRSTSQPDGSSVNSLFVISDTLYASTANGFIYYSINGGTTWIRSASQPDGSSVTSIYVMPGVIYAGTAQGHVYYSTNNGASWIALNGKPDNSAITHIFVSQNTLYVNTAHEYVYSTTSLRGGGIWTPVAQTVYSLFVNTNNTLYAGTQSGRVFSITEGVELGFITSSPINGLYILSS